jgi:hypothetical protein
VQKLRLGWRYETKPTSSRIKLRAHRVRALAPSHQQSDSDCEPADNRATLTFANEYQAPHAQRDLLSVRPDREGHESSESDADSVRDSAAMFVPWRAHGVRCVAAGTNRLILV